MKGIMQLPSISIIKNYINENQQHLEWQNKTAYLILEKMAIKNIGSYGRIGFFSHDSFKIQKVYYGINTLTAHEINKMLFQLVANLEYIGIHTCGSICDGAGENRNHIKSFDWWASSWSLEDIVEVNIGKNNYEQAKIIITNIDRSKFTEFIHYSYLYQQIFHSKKPLEGLDDSRLHTLKNVHD
ncbi:hypothetical protein C1645_847296 [Glomus cerebriforme]|uniref:Uncharacterized protein n=1 Tax=Glomus cerebriforme TaxID=658196 RepID=A0A397SZE4_9GLOM|nr:hypothetical protein C1645_847296 [Glomus cerebriforme]